MPKIGMEPGNVRKKQVIIVSPTIYFIADRGAINPINKEFLNKGRIFKS